MKVFGKNVVRELLSDPTKIKKIYLTQNFKDNDILNAIKSNHVILKPEDSFGKTVDLEIETTMWISKMIEAAREEKDWQTEGWLKRTLMEEQIDFCLKVW